MKICIECLIDKKDCEFSFYQFKRNKSRCKNCISTYQKKYRDSNREKIKDNSKKYYKENKDKISKLKDKYNKLNKDKILADKKQYYERNKEKHLKKDKDNYIKNRKIILIYKKQYYSLNKDFLNEKSRLFYKVNKLQIIKNQNKKRSERLKTDMVFKLRENISTAIRFHLKSNNSSKKGESYLKYLPYTINELKIHLESLFEPWMSWNNQGNYNKDSWDDNDQSTWKWQLDHIIPHSKFDYKTMDCEEFRQCWLLNNLRPLSAKQNIIDGNRRY